MKYCDEVYCSPSCESAMAPMKVRVNTYFQENQRPFVDPISKFYIIAEGLFGLNRLPVILKETRFCHIFTAIFCIYSFALFFGIICTASLIDILDIVWYMSCFEYVFCALFSFLSWKRMERYFNEVSKFDSEIGCRPQMTSESFRNAFVMIVFTSLLGSLYGLSLVLAWDIPLFLQTMPLMLIHCIEVYYYGHLLSLLAPRLRLINYYVESALSTGKDAKRPNVEEFISFKYKNNKNGEMKKLMDLYHIVIRSYDFLIEAIKWQLLVILVSSFICTLSFCYHVSISIIRGENPLEDTLTDMTMMGIEMIPLFSPCMFGDRVHNEVRRLRELLASRLYENKLDKPGRSAARALLALTEARDLSFSLLRMLQIDISLPFKFIGLLVTYLIILLQFEKVINPSNSTRAVTKLPFTTQSP